MAELPDLHDFVRSEALPQGATLLLRGGPDTAAKVRAHAERVRRAFVLRGEAVLGISVFAALDDIGPASFEGIQAGKLATYRLVHSVAVSAVAKAGFGLLPTFERPHMTLLLRTVDDIDRLLRILGPPRPNPKYGEMTRRTRKRPT